MKDANKTSVKIEPPLQGCYGASFVVIAIIVGLIAIAKHSFILFDTHKVSDEGFLTLGGGAMMILLLALSVVSAIFLFLDAAQAKRLANLEKMMSQLMSAQGETTTCPKCGAELSPKSKFLPKCGEKQE